MWQVKCTITLYCIFSSIVHVILLFRSEWELIPYAQGPCRTHTLGPHGYGLANFTLLTHTPYNPVCTGMVHINEPQHDKNLQTVRPANTEISLGISPVWLESSFVVRSMDNQGHKGPSCGQRRLWSYYADAQPDLSLRWAHRFFCWFWRVAA